MPLASLVTDFQVLLLMSVRIIVLLSLTPIISGPSSPFLIRLVLSALVAYIIKNILGYVPFETPERLGDFVILLAGEALIGAIIGFFIQIAFLLLGAVSEYFTTLMGLRAAQVLNPLTGAESVIMSQFMNLVVIIVFISSYSLQKIFYYGVMQSFIALNAITLFQAKDQSFLGFLFYGFSQLFERSFIIALPIFISLLVVSIGLGLYGKVAPQMNLLVLGLPIQVGMGLVFLMFLLPVLIRGMETTFDTMFRYVSSFIKGVLL